MPTEFSLVCELAARARPRWLCIFVFVGIVENLLILWYIQFMKVAIFFGSKSDKDIAVVAVKLSDIKESTIANIAIAELADTADVVIGQPVVAIGNALEVKETIETLDKLAKENAIIPLS